MSLWQFPEVDPVRLTTGPLLSQIFPWRDIRVCAHAHTRACVCLQRLQVCRGQTSSFDVDISISGTSHDATRLPGAVNFAA